MISVRLKIEYDGTDFHGWQRQPEAPTIQATLEEALFRSLGRKATLYGASRTDSGVHAKGQVAHFYHQSHIPAERFRIILNTLLPPTIRIVESLEVPDKFHSRKDALSKIYEYRILNRKYPSALDRRVYFYPGSLRWARIAKAVPLFIGEKDFRAFQAANAQTNTTTRTVLRFELMEEDPQNGLYRFIIEGNGFLKQMIRTIIGTLMEVGEDKRDVNDIESLFLLKKRELAGRTAPASGLCLVEVKYHC